MSHLDPIFAVWDHNAEELAKSINEDATKVRQWRHRKSIPPSYWERIIAEAKRKGTKLTWTQFLPPKEAEESNQETEGDPNFCDAVGAPGHCCCGAEVCCDCGKPVPKLAPPPECSEAT